MTEERMALLELVEKTADASRCRGVVDHLTSRQSADHRRGP